MTLEQARRAHRCLQSVWVIVSSQHDDAVAKDVEAMGRKLSAALDERDLAACQVAVQEVRTWLTSSAGVVVSRLQHVFESAD